MGEIGSCCVANTELNLIIPLPHSVKSILMLALYSILEMERFLIEELCNKSNVSGKKYLAGVYSLDHRLKKKKL